MSVVEIIIGISLLFQGNFLGFILIFDGFTRD